MSYKTFGYMKHAESYKENYLIKKSALALNKTKTDPISHKVYDDSKTNPNNFKPTIKVNNLLFKTNYKTVNKLSLAESFNNIFINDEKEGMKKSHSKKTFAINKNSPSDYFITPFARKVFPDKYKNIFNINDEDTKVTYRTNIRVNTSYGKPSKDLIKYNDKVNDLPANYYNKYKDNIKRNKSISRSHSKSKIFFNIEDNIELRSPKRRLHPFIKDHMEEILSYRNALNYRIEKLTPKINNSITMKDYMNIKNSNNSHYEFFKQRNHNSNVI